MLLFIISVYASSLGRGLDATDSIDLCIRWIHPFKTANHLREDS